MSANFLHPSFTGRSAAQAEVPPGDAESQPPGSAAIDWRAARLAGRACCCSARPVVIAVMPPTARRLHPTDLLLCGHHYRASRRAPGLAGATLLDLAGRPIAGDLWSAGAHA